MDPGFRRESGILVAGPAFLATNTDELVISDFAAAEVASALSRLVRMGQLSAANAALALSDFDIWRAATNSDAEVHAADARLAYAYVRRFDLMLQSPDAIHLAICGTTGCIARDLGSAIATCGRGTRDHH
jgi:hypothetical protein